MSLPKMKTMPSWTSFFNDVTGKSDKGDFKATSAKEGPRGTTRRRGPWNTADASIANTLNILRNDKGEVETPSKAGARRPQGHRIAREDPRAPGAKLGFASTETTATPRSKKPSPPTPSPDANGTQISSSPGSPPHPKLRRSHSMNSVMSDVAETDMVPPAESTPRRTEDGASATGVDGRPFVDRSTPRRSPASSFNRNVGDSGEIGVRGDVGRERAIRSNSDTAEPSAGNRRARTSGSDGLRISPRGRTNSSPRSGGGVPTGWASPRPTECSGIGESARKNNGFSDSGGGEKAGGSRVNVASIRSRWEERSSIGSSGGGGGGGSGDRGRGDVGFGLIRRSSFGVDTDAKGRGSRRNTVGPFPRLMPPASGGGYLSEGADDERLERTGSSVSAEGDTRRATVGPLIKVTRKKKTFMEKFGDMLEAAAETAIPANPAIATTSAVRRTWDHWDVANLGEFMTEEVRTMADKRRREDVAQAGGEKRALIQLAKDWKIPFISQAEYSRQRAALRNPDIGLVDDDGRCVSASLRTSGNTSSSSPGAVQRPLRSEGQPSNPLVGGGGGRGGKDGPGLPLEEGWIYRAVVLGYVVQGGGCGRGEGGGEATSTATQYLVEVETLGEGGGSWACYKRYSDFRTLWKGLSTEYPRLEAFDFPPKTSVFSRRSLFFRARRVEETRQRKFTAILQMLLSLDPRPQELVRFLQPHTAAGDAPLTAAVDAARRAAANPAAPSGNLGSRWGGGKSGDRGCVSAGGGVWDKGPNDRAVSFPVTVTLRLFLATVGAVEISFFLHAAGFTRTTATSAAATWIILAAIAIAVVLSGWVSKKSERRRLRLSSSGSKEGGEEERMMRQRQRKQGKAAMLPAKDSKLLAVAGGTGTQSSGSGRAVTIKATTTAVAGVPTEGGSNAVIGAEPAANYPAGTGSGNDNGSGHGTGNGNDSSVNSVSFNGGGDGGGDDAETGDGKSAGEWVLFLMVAELCVLVSMVALHAHRSCSRGRQTIVSTTAAAAFHTAEMATDSTAVGFMMPSSGIGAEGAMADEEWLATTDEEWLIGALASAALRAIMAAARAVAVAVGVAVIPTVFAALVTAHVAGTFDGSNGAAGSSRGARRVRDDGGKALATAPAEAVISSDGGPILLSRASGNGTSGGVPGGIHYTGSVAAEGGSAGMINGEPSSARERSRRRAMALPEAMLRLVIVGGGAVSIVGGMMTLVVPLAVFLLGGFDALLSWCFARWLPFDSLRSAAAMSERAVGGVDTRHRERDGYGDARMPSSRVSRRIRPPLEAITGNSAKASLSFPPSSVGTEPQGGQAASGLAWTRTRWWLGSGSNSGDGSQLVPASSTTDPARTSSKQQVKQQKKQPKHEKGKGQAMQRVRSRWVAIKRHSHRLRTALARRIMPRAVDDDAADASLTAISSSDSKSSGSVSVGNGDSRKRKLALPVPPKRKAPPPPDPARTPALSPSTLEASSSPGTIGHMSETQEWDFAWNTAEALSLGGRCEVLELLDCAAALVYAPARARHRLSISSSSSSSSNKNEVGICSEGWRRSAENDALDRARGGGGSLISSIPESDVEGFQFRTAGMPEAGSGGPGSGEATFVPPFRSPGDVWVMWLVLGVVWATVRRECRLAYARKWRALALLLTTKVLIAGLVSVLFRQGGALMLVRSSAGTRPATLLCVMEAGRCVTLLVLLISVVRAGVKPERRCRKAARSTLLASWTKGEEPTTPRRRRRVRTSAIPDGSSSGGSDQRQQEHGQTPSTSRKTRGGQGDRGRGSGASWSNDSWHAVNGASPEAEGITPRRHEVEEEHIQGPRAIYSGASAASAHELGPAAAGDHPRSSSVIAATAARRDGVDGARGGMSSGDVVRTSAAAVGTARDYSRHAAGSHRAVGTKLGGDNGPWGNGDDKE